MTRATPPTFLAILRAALVQVRGDLRPAFVGAGIFTAFLPALLILWLSRLNLTGGPGTDSLTVAGFVGSWSCMIVNVLRDPRVFVLAALAHLHLAWIHPFGDGNGRISRLLEFEILLRASIPVPAAHLLSDHYNKTRDHYYAILERTSRADGYPMEDFVHYAIEGLVDGLREQLQKVRDMQMIIMWQSYVHERFHGRHTPARTRMRDVVLLLPPGEWTAPDDIVMLSKDINDAYRGKTSKTISRDINALESMGLVEKRRGRGMRPRIKIITTFLDDRSEERRQIGRASCRERV